MNPRALAGALVAALLVSAPLLAQVPSLTATFAKLESTLPATDWRPLQQSWTPAIVKQVAALFGEERRAEHVVKTWREGRSLIWLSKTKPGQQIALSVARLETEAAARSYFGFVVDLQRKQDEQTAKSCGPAMQILDTKSQSVSLLGVPDAVRIDKRLKQGSETMAITTLLARVGDNVVVCDWYGAPANLTWAEGVVAELRK